MDIKYGDIICLFGLYASIAVGMGIYLHTGLPMLSGNWVTRLLRFCSNGVYIEIYGELTVSKESGRIGEVGR